MTISRWWTLAALIVTGPWATATAQQDPRLAGAVRLAQDGMADSARAVVARILTAAAPTDSIYPEALYTSALVAQTEADRRLALRRVIFEFSQTAWADDALFLLGQLEYADGNPTGTVRQMERLINDYPTSPLFPQATFWGARAASDAKNPALACRWLDAGLKAVGNEVELRGLMEFQQQRCSALVAQTPVDTAAAASTTPRDTAKPATTKPRKGPVFRVQVTAAKTQADADKAVAALRRLEYETVVQKEGGFFKVRAGAFATRAEASAALAKIRARLGGQPFVVHEP